MRLHASAAIANGVALLFPQVVALFLLGPAAYGVFSLIYLVYALGTSLALSVVLEAWSRTKVVEGVVGPWSAYSSVLSMLSLIVGAMSVAVVLVAEGSAFLVAATFAAVALSVYRFGARYFEVQSGEMRRSLKADLAAVGAMVGGLIFLSMEGASVGRVLTVWALGQTLASFVGLKPALPNLRRLREWMGDHSSSIRPLLRDSILMDASAIGTPYMLTGVLGLAGIGVYRAVSSISAPVRLVLTTARPVLARATPARLRQPKLLVCVLGGGVLSSAATYFALLVLDTLGEFGVLSHLQQHALPTALFVGANFLGQFYAISMRINAPSGRTLGARMLQSGLGILLPLAGALAWGLSGAIWGYSLATVIAAANWMVQALRRTSGS